MKIGFHTKAILAALFVLIGATWLMRDVWQPHYYSWHCEQMATELSEKYGLVVRYGNPAEFFVPPHPPLVDIPGKGFSIGRTKLGFAHTALKGVKSAIAKYPPSLLKKHLSAVFIAGDIKIYNVKGGGTYFNSWIYLSALGKYEQAGKALYAENFHHEFSSLLLKNGDFPRNQWKAINTPDFSYLSRQVDVVQSAAQKNRRSAKEAPSWYQNGFVHDYGMSSLENDLNTYAELAMTDPAKLKTLVQQYPRIKAKTRILVEFYRRLAPELGTYFKSVGLADDTAGK